MTTIKSFTDLPQSKVLAKILPLDSADMYWSRCTITDFDDDDVLKVSYAVEPCNISQFRNTKEDIPCWSLAALISVLPQFIEFRGDKYYLRFMKEYVEYGNDEISITGRCLHIIGNDNLVDACYAMILKLNEMKIL